ncbi:hypothetical protein AN641_01180 [Candidatus Epulonipiscioides gigas]|nr:hypothetical protein AN641_01180 [Epulopiscium sp. SCG-C07WGA-EpuloA2]
MIRKAIYNDINQVNIYFNEARNYFKQNNINQWQGLYPNGDYVINDIKIGNGYVFEENAKVKAYFFLIFGADPTYTKIYDGKWLTDKSYGVIHRIVVGMDFRQEGIGNKIFQYCIEKAQEKNNNMRIDTHKDNIAMQKLIEKNKFEYCGIILTGDNSQRLAYELNIRG